MASICDLNDDCLIQILNKLPVYDLLIALLTFPRFKEVAKFVFPKLCFRLTDVRQLYEIYSVAESNDIVQNKIRKLSINLRTEHSDLAPFINSITDKLEELTITDGCLNFEDHYRLIKLCQNVRDLHLVNVSSEDNFMEKILSKNNCQLKVLSTDNGWFHEKLTFFKDFRKLEKITILSYSETISLKDFHLENSPELEELWISFHRSPRITGSDIRNILQIRPKLKTLSLTNFKMEENECIDLEQYLAEENRLLIFGVDNDSVFNKVMDNPDYFKYLSVKRVYSSIEIHREQTVAQRRAAFREEKERKSKKRRY